MMKRIREGEITSMANYLILLSSSSTAAAGEEDDDFSRVFTCKTCDRQFSSFQALGGHRASHKKPRMSPPPPAAAGAGDHRQLPLKPKPKTHECPVCGLEFPIGQALGGHMRRHRLTIAAPGDDAAHHKLLLQEEVNNCENNNNNNTTNNNNRRRILCVDLNLTPMENNFAPVHCFF